MIQPGEHIRMDEKDIRTLDLPDFRNQIGYVPQDVFLFSDTVTGNILFGLERKSPSGSEERQRNLPVLTKKFPIFPLVMIP